MMFFGIESGISHPCLMQGFKIIAFRFIIGVMIAVSDILSAGADECHGFFNAEKQIEYGIEKQPSRQARLSKKQVRKRKNKGHRTLYAQNRKAAYR